MLHRAVIVGTAGHIDHGKTALVSKLTGKDTDRLKEEKERGISIDIDFAPLCYDDGLVMGMVDVPGHERFIRNMLAGATGIDIALIVIDVNEGIKPQTWEHIRILELLGITRGVIAITKVDLVDEAWRVLAEDVVREGLRDTVFADAPTVQTSVKTGEGIERLKNLLRETAGSVATKDTTGAFRMPLDKTFSIPGFGTVVSGTVWRGALHVGDAIQVLPNRRSIRVRGIQVHGRPVESCGAGQRAAVNITGVERGEILRGAVLAWPDTLTETKRMDVELRLLHSAARPILHRDRVHIHLGTSQTVGRVLLLESDLVAPGESGLAQVLLEREVVCQATDRFVIRSYSPMHTIGGGIVIEPSPIRLHRRKRSDILESLRARNQDTPLQRVMALANQGVVITKQKLVQDLGLTAEQAATVIADGLMARQFVELPTGCYASQHVAHTLSQLTEILLAEHRKKRLSRVVPRTTFANAAASLVPSRDFDWFLAMGQTGGLWSVTSSGAQAAGWTIDLKPEEESIYKTVERLICEAGIAGVPESDLTVRFPKRDRVVKNLLQYGLENGALTQIDAGLWVHQTTLEDLMNLLYDRYLKYGAFSLAQVRDWLRTGRKQALIVLEYLDQQGVTRREGDQRVIINVSERFAEFI